MFGHSLTFIQKLENGNLAKGKRLLRLVKRESATRAIPNEKFHNQIPIHADHSGMVKFNSDDDVNYEMVLAGLTTCI